MPGMMEMTEEMAPHIPAELIELKVDGTRMTYDGQDMYSDRLINRNARYPHILEELRSLNIYCRGEVALPGASNISQLSKKENWPHAVYYIFDLYWLDDLECNSLPITQKRGILEDLIKQNSFRHIELPKKFKSFAEGWSFVLEHEREGVVLKLPDGTCYKVKHLKEEKLQIVDHIPGKAKGAFMLDRKGILCKVSATSETYVQAYKALKDKGLDVYAEIEYPYLTDAGKPYQPRLRRIGTLKDLEIS